MASAPEATSEAAAAPRGNTVALVPSRSYAERTRDQRMAPYLRLSGVLQSGDREDRCFELPRARFQPRLRLGVERRMSIDLIRDVSPPPRRVSAGERFSLSGKVAL